MAMNQYEEKEKEDEKTYTGADEQSRGTSC